MSLAFPNEETRISVGTVRLVDPVGSLPSPGVAPNRSGNIPPPQEAAATKRITKDASGSAVHQFSHDGFVEKGLAFFQLS